MKIYRTLRIALFVIIAFVALSIPDGSDAKTLPPRYQNCMEDQAFSDALSEVYRSILRGDVIGKRKVDPALLPPADLNSASEGDSQ